MEFLDTRLDEVYVPCSDSRAIPSSPLQLDWRMDFPWQHERLPEFPVVLQYPAITREKPRGAQVITK